MKRFWIVFLSVLFLTGCTFFTNKTTTTSTTTSTMSQTTTATSTTRSTTMSLTVPDLLIYEVYGGGGNVGATYRNDYVVLYNPSDSAFDLSHCSLQYSPAPSVYFSAYPLSGTIAANGFFLLTLSGGVNGDPVPVSFGSSITLNIAATAGKIALAIGNMAIGGVDDPAVLDFLGYGSSVTVSEGSPTGNLGNALSARRTSFTDTNDNSADFAVGVPNLQYVLDTLVLTGISLSGWDGVYGVGESLNLKGALILGNYAGGQTSAVVPEASMVTGFDSSVPGDFVLHVTYGAFSADFPYVVLDPSLSEPLTVSYIDIGMGGGGPGEATLIEYGDIDVLVDSGENSPEATNELLSFLAEHVTDGIVEYIIATHQDADHIGGFTEVMDVYQVPNAIIYSTPDSIATSLRRTFESRLTTEGTSVVRIKNLVSSGKPTVSLAEGIVMRFYDTNYLETAVANASCLVFVLEAYETRILFTGDAEADQEAVYAPLVGDVDVFKMGHHGSNGGTSTFLLTYITPEVAIVSDGDILGNEYNHPTYGAVGRIYSYSSAIPVYAVTGGNGKAPGTPITWQRNGTITITVNAAGYSIASEYYGDSPFELSQTDYWNDASNPNRDEGYVPTAFLPSGTDPFLLGFGLWDESGKKHEDEVRA